MKLGEQTTRMGKYEVLQAAKRKFFTCKNWYYANLPDVINEPGLFNIVKPRYVLQLMCILTPYNRYYIELFYDRKAKKFDRIEHGGAVCKLEK